MNLFVLLLSVNLVAAAPPAFSVKTVDGRLIRGSLGDWSDQGLLVVDGDRQERLAPDQLLWVAPVESPPPLTPPGNVWITLVDGSVIVSRSYTADADHAIATTNRVGAVRLAPASIDHVRFHAAPPGLQERWSDILRKPIDRDMLVIANGDVLDYLGGIVRAVDEQSINFDLDGDVVTVRRGKAFAIRYYRPDRADRPEPLARVTDDDGSIWAIQQAALSNGELVCQTPHGTRVTLPLGAVIRIDFAGAGLVPLGDLTPESCQWTPYFGSPESVTTLARLYHPRTNTTFDSSPIVLDGVKYEHGLTLHSRTEMTYRLTEPYARFQALAGIDDRLRPRGNVALRILGDDRVLYDGMIAGTESSQPIDISLKGVIRLTIVVDFGADLDVGDHLILAEAKLLK